MGTLLEKELEISREVGFKSKEEFIEEAVKTFLASRKDLRISMSIALYNEEKISFGKALEISGLNIEEFKKELNNRDIKRKSSDSTDSKTAALKYAKKI